MSFPLKRFGSQLKTLLRHGRHAGDRRRTRRLLVETLEPRVYLSLTVPALSSLPGADHTIYLDFDGHVTKGTSWNDYFSNPAISSLPYDNDGNPTSFNSTELLQIENVWRRVSEDFIPFSVNVTTVDPGVEALRKSNSTDTAWGVRAVITDDTEGSGVAGLSYTGSFNHATDTPAFIYTKGEKTLAESVSHEVGHTLYLSHDGTAATAYYSGHGSGDTGWAPIMGASYTKNVTTWDRGEFYGAANSGTTANQKKGPSDLTVITTYNGFGFRPDDHPDTSGKASSLTVAGPDLSGSGIIETASDVDVFSFTTDTGSVTLSVSPFRPGPNLDVKAVLYDDAGGVVAASDPSSTLDAKMDLDLNAGRYYLHVMGTGTGGPTKNPPTGYTDYASLGRYTVTGTVVEPTWPVPAADPLTPDEIGFQRSNFFALDLNGNGRWEGRAGGDVIYGFGQPGDTPLIGDWNGDGMDEIGFHRGNFFALDLNGNGRWEGRAAGDVIYGFGQPGDTPLIGDWDGDGMDEIGFHRGNFFALDLNGNGRWEGRAGGDVGYRLGQAGDTPLIGDWDGDGTDKIGFHRGNFFALDLNGNGRWEGRAGGDVGYRLGQPGDTPLIGDWDGDGTDNLGFHRGNFFALDLNGNGRWDGRAAGDVGYGFGQPGDTPLTGKWAATATPLMAAAVPTSLNVSKDRLTTDIVARLVQSAVDVWSASAISPQQQRLLEQLDVQVADLPGGRLGERHGVRVTVDVDAAGWGWFADPTPGDDVEFSAVTRGGKMTALPGSAADDRMDLLTVFVHEVGHMLDHGHEVNGVMQETLPLGTRRVLVSLPPQRDLPPLEGNQGVFPVPKALAFERPASPVEWTAPLQGPRANRSDRLPVVYTLGRPLDDGHGPARHFGLRTSPAEGRSVPNGAAAKGPGLLRDSEFGGLRRELVDACFARLGDK